MVPDLLTPNLIELQNAAAQLAEALIGLHEDDRHRLRVKTVAQSRAAGLYDLPQQDRPDKSLALALVRDTLAAHNVIDRPGLFAPSAGALAAVGEPLKSRYLEPLLAGEKQGGFGFAEPADAPRPTWARIQTDRLIVNGEKSYVTGGAEADFITTLVELEDIGPALVVIDTSSPGVEIVRRFESLDGSHHAAIRFRDVEVPKEHMIAEVGLRRAVSQISGVRMAMAATSVGLARWVVAHVEQYIADQEARHGMSERHRLRYGQMRIMVYGARSALYRTARLIDAGNNSVNSVNSVNEVMMVKHLATETVSQVVDMAIQSVGGQALVVGHPLESIYRRVRSLRLAEGASDVLALNTARGRLDLNLGRL